MLRSVGLALSRRCNDDPNIYFLVETTLARIESCPEYHIFTSKRLNNQSHPRTNLWKEFVEYFVGADGAGSEDAPSEPWFEQERDIAQKVR